MILKIIKRFFNIFFKNIQNNDKHHIIIPINYIEKNLKNIENIV
jgi:hypothetical protein